ncbi:putative assembly protein [Pseudooceanicola marinus]|uniref:Putative assembly protein n=1 Tax=Pseudooceanicola marinus TaxID=396013 RepID=A0A1X6Z5J0_9RHOB|nr:AsmA family protein [Pseudooceanicola marinus]PJE32202.1 AsmA family protein [Pseudooceanicola marinus]SLN41735.1 putative assembly protein [Pseudooceanicola marinus]
MRWILRILGALVLAVVLLAGALLLLPGEKIAGIAADRIEEITGRQLTIAGETRLSYYPVLGVRTGPVSLSNASWSNRGPMFEAESLQIGVDLMALLGGDVRITELDAEAPAILLERNAEGAVNWDLLPEGAASGAGAPATAEEARQITLDRLFIRNASIRYIDAAMDSDQRLEGLELTLSLPDASGPADITLGLDLPGGRITGEGRVARARTFLDGGVSDLSLAFSAPGGTARFEGRGGIAPEADGHLVLSVSDAGQLFSVLGEQASLPGALNGDLGFDGQVTLTADGAVSLRDGTLRGAGNAAAVEADIRPGAVTRITAQVVAETLDLTAFTGSKGGGSGRSGGGPSGWSSAPVDVSALNLVEGDIVLSAGTVDLGVTRLTQLRSRVTVDRARAVATINQMGVFGGGVTGQLVANNRSGLSIGGDLSAAGVDLNRMLDELAGIDRFTGSADAALNFLAVGNSVQAWMSSLSGSGSLSTGRGTISGIDLDRVLRSGDVSGGTTIFDATEASFSIADGVLSNDDLEMRLASITATGEGTVDMGQQRLNYLFTPVALKDDEGRGIAIPVRIRGPWASPQILPDLERAIQLNSDLDAEQIEETAKDRVRAEVEGALGVTREEGESDEELLRRGLENKLQDELRNLFK